MKGYPEPVVSSGGATVGDTIISIDDIRLDRVLRSGANGFVFDGEDLLLKRRVDAKMAATSRSPWERPCNAGSC